MINEKFINSIRIDGEKWKYADEKHWYAVSSLGRTCSLERTILQKDGKKRTYPPRLLNGEYNRDGYRMIIINNGCGKRKLVNVHRIVADAFVPNPNNFPCVDHIDRNRKNNHADNLRWVTQIENLHNREPRPVARICNGIIDKVYPYLYSVSEDGFWPQSVSNCCHGRWKTHKGYKWEYL